jgi:hypothetical protein
MWREPLLPPIPSPPPSDPGLVAEEGVELADVEDGQLHRDPLRARTHGGSEKGGGERIGGDLVDWRARAGHFEDRRRNECEWGGGCSFTPPPLAGPLARCSVPAPFRHPSRSTASCRSMEMRWSPCREHSTHAPRRAQDRPRDMRRARCASGRPVAHTACPPPRRFFQKPVSAGESEPRNERFWSLKRWRMFLSRATFSLTSSFFRKIWSKPRSMSSSVAILSSSKHA